MKATFVLPLLLCMSSCANEVHHITKNSSKKGLPAPAPSLVGNLWEGTWEAQTEGGKERFFFGGEERVVWQKRTPSRSEGSFDVVERELVLKAQKGVGLREGKESPTLEFRVTHVTADTSRPMAKVDDRRVCFYVEAATGLGLECSPWIAAGTTLSEGAPTEALTLGKVTSMGAECTMGSTVETCKLPPSSAPLCSSKYFASYCRHEDTQGCDAVPGGCFGSTPGGHWQPIVDWVDGEPVPEVRCLCPQKGFVALP